MVGTDMKLSLHTSRAGLVMKTINSEMSIKQPQAQLDLTNERAQPRFQNKRSEVSVDSTAAWESMNHRGIGPQMRVFFDKGRQAALEATARYAQEGNAMAATKNPRETIAAYGVERSGRTDFPETVVTAMPSVPPEITWSKGEIKTLFSKGRLKFDWDTNRTAQISATRGKVEIKANTPRPPVRVEYTGGMYHPMKGYK